MSSSRESRILKPRARRIVRTVALFASSGRLLRNVDRRRRSLGALRTGWLRAHWFTSLARSARTHAFLEFARKLALCRGPESDRRHMVLQTIALPTELPRRDRHFTGNSSAIRAAIERWCASACWCVMVYGFFPNRRGRKPTLSEHPTRELYT